METEWLETTLSEHKDARHKLVLGHHRRLAVGAVHGERAVGVPAGVLAQDLVRPGGCLYLHGCRQQSLKLHRTSDPALDPSDAEGVLVRWVGHRPGWTPEWIAEKVQHALRYGKEPIGALR